MISILDNRLSKNICAYFENCYSLDERSAVKLVVIDLNANYQRRVKHSRIYKALKINWRLFHKDTAKINRSKAQYFRELNEYTTQYNLIDLGFTASSKFKYAYETAHQIQEAIKKQDSKKLVQSSPN